MNENVRYWIWLQQSLKEGAEVSELIDEFGGARQIYEADIISWRMSTCLTAKQITRMSETKLNVADEIIYNCESNGWSIITPDDKEYPNRLKCISNFPLALYVSGTLPDIDNSVVVSIVGTRKASEYAIKCADVMAKGLAKAGVIIVSGGALGIDSASHKGALAYGGKTIAVLGCGLGTKYLMQNKAMRKSIAENGALISEYPPFTMPSKFTFPQRNRIISALALGVVVVEAAQRSGSLITASCALEQGKDVFAVPGSILSVDYAGTNSLIENGAFVATSPAVILNQYSSMLNDYDEDKTLTIRQILNNDTDVGANLPKKEEEKYSINRVEQSRAQRCEKESKIATLSISEKTVYGVLTDSFAPLDIITQKCALTGSKVLSALTTLELFDLAEQTTGSRFKLK